MGGGGFTMEPANPLLDDFVLSLVERSAKTPAEVQGTSLVPLAPRQVATTLPPVPDRVDVKNPVKGHGRARVIVYETPGAQKGQYVAQSSPDPYGPTTWGQLGVGHGKSRWVGGLSGTKVWVRFARIRGQAQSEWSTPVLVTIPVPETVMVRCTRPRQAGQRSPQDRPG